MSGKSMLGSALAEVAGPLKDFAGKLSGENGEQWLVAFKGFLRKEEPWPIIPIWRTVKRGADFENPVVVRHALSEYKVSNRANYMMSQTAFAKSLKEDSEREYDLVILTTSQLTGKKQGGTIAEVFAGAARLGLEKCLAWMGPRLRIDYQNQPNGEWILIGMDPILGSDGRLLVFCVDRGDSGLWLLGDWRDPGYVWNPDRRWVFVRPRK